MSKNLVIGTNTYEGVSTVNFNTADDSVAVFKDVDEMTSGSFDIPTELTLLGTNGAEDILLNTFFTEHPLKVAKNNFYFFTVVGDTAPTKGSHTLKMMIIAFDDRRTATVPPAQLAFFLRKYNELAAPSSFGEDGLGMNTTLPNTAYITRDGYGYLTFNAAITEYYIPANASVYYAEYPISFATCLPHE